jgi:hypothetical protein
MKDKPAGDTSAHEFSGAPITASPRQSSGKSDAVDASASGSDSRADPLSAYALAVADAQSAAQRQYQTAYLNYLQALGSAANQPAIQDTLRAHANKVNSAAPDTEPSLIQDVGQVYLESVKRAQQAVEVQVQAAYQALVDEFARASAEAIEVQRAQVVELVKRLQSDFSGTAAQDIDAQALGRLGQTLLAAALLRSQVA